MSLLLLSLLTAPADAARYDVDVPEALALHVSVAGLDRIGDAVEAMVPDRISVSAAQELACTDDTLLSVSLPDLSLIVSMDDVAVDPSPGRIDLTLAGAIWSDPTELRVEGSCAFLTGVDETCDFQVPITAFQAHVGIQIAANGTAIDVIVDPPTFSLSPIPDPLSGCGLISAASSVLLADPRFVSGLIEDAVQPMLATVPEMVQEQLGTALDSVIIEQSTYLGLVPVFMESWPTRVDVDEGGLVVGFGAHVRVYADEPTCEDPFGGPPTGTGWPDIDGTAGDSSLAYDAGLMVSADLLDAAVWTAWAAGGLCSDMTHTEDGMEVTATLLATFLGTELTDLVGPMAPATVVMRNPTPPIFSFGSDAPVFGFFLDTMTLGLMLPLADRQVRVLEAGVEVVAGIDIHLTAERLWAELVLPGDAIRFTERYSELMRPGFAEGLEQMLTFNMQASGLDPAAMMPDIALPHLYGLDFSTVSFQPEEDHSWHGMYLTFDTDGIEAFEVPALVATPEGGCGGSDMSGAGCEEGSAGCEGEGCDSAPGPGRLIPSLFALLVLLGRRARRIV